MTLLQEITAPLEGTQLPRRPSHTADALRLIEEAEALLCEALRAGMAFVCLLAPDGLAVELYLHAERGLSRRCLQALIARLGDLLPESRLPSPPAEAYSVHGSPASAGVDAPGCLQTLGTLLTAPVPGQPAPWGLVGCAGLPPQNLHAGAILGRVASLLAAALHPVQGLEECPAVAQGPASDVAANPAPQTLASADLYNLLECQKRHMEAILRNMADGLVVLDSQGRISTLNAAAERMLEVTEAEVLGQAPDEQASSAGLRALAQICRAASAEPIYHPALLNASELDDKPGVVVELPTPRVLKVLSSPIEATPCNSGGEIKVLHDVTPEREFARMRSEFVSTVSHELRTPLFAVKGFVELLLKGKAPDPAIQHEFLTRVAEQTSKLSAIVSDLLDTSRMEAGKVELSRAPIDIVETVRAALARLETVAHSHSITLELEAGDGLPTVPADPRRIDQVITNLVSNACKFSPPGESVLVRVQGDRREVHVQVIDHGIGIPEEAIPRLFTRFYQADSSATRRVGGTGLGLYISRNIIQAHGGRIGVESRLGSGSVFTFTLPVPRQEG